MDIRNEARRFGIVTQQAPEPPHTDPRDARDDHRGHGQDDPDGGDDSGSVPREVHPYDGSEKITW